MAGTIRKPNLNSGPAEEFDKISVIVAEHVPAGGKLNEGTVEYIAEDIIRALRACGLDDDDINRLGRYMYV
jgi:hypothetical protein